MEYEYSKTNRLKHPHTYMYTTYRGKSFLRQYLKSREKYLAVIKQKIKTTQSENIKKLLNSLDIRSDKFWHDIYIILKGRNPTKKNNKNDIKKFLNNLKPKDSIDALGFFKETACFIISSKKQNISLFYDILNTFIKKYEIFKRIFSQYSGKFKKMGDNYASVSHYIFISFCILYYYNKIPNLKFLNAGLKINDAICSVINKVKNDEELLILYLALLIEKQALNQLITKKGLSL